MSKVTPPTTSVPTSKVAVVAGAVAVTALTGRFVWKRVKNRKATK